MAHLSEADPVGLAEQDENLDRLRQIHWFAVRLRNRLYVLIPRGSRHEGKGRHGGRCESTEKRLYGASEGWMVGSESNSI